VESFNSKLRDELLDRELFTTTLEAQVLGEQYRTYYNTERPHSALKYQAPAAFAADHVDNTNLELARLLT
jgi:transposase InsO family protein